MSGRRSTSRGRRRWRPEDPEEEERVGARYNPFVTLEDLCRAMSLKLLMSTDQLLQEVFAEYLKLPVFPVSLEYRSSDSNTGQLVDPSHSSLDVWASPLVQHDLFEWVESHRLPYFAKSLMYAELTFCSQLMRRRSIHISYSQFKCFRYKLSGTKGGLHLELWLSLKSLFPPCFSDGTIVDHFDFEKLGSIIRQYSSVLIELKMPLFPVYCGPLSKIKWVEYILSQLMQRLCDYWWLRSSAFLCPNGCCTHERSLPHGEADVELALKLDREVGYPFLDYLHREAADDDVVNHGVLEDVIHILGQQWRRFEMKRNVSTFLGKHSSEVVKRLGLSALLQAKSDEDILRSLSDIKDKLLLSLRRKWRAFMHNDYESFCSCFPLQVRSNFLPAAMIPSTDPINNEYSTDHKEQLKSTCISGRRKKVRLVCHKPQVTLSMVDLSGTPLGSFPNPQAVTDFKCFLEDTYGFDSQQIVSFEAWLAILLHQKVPKGCKNYHARKIYRDFISPHSKVPLEISKRFKKPVARRPPSPVLRELQSFTFENFADDLVEFFRILNGSSAQSSHPTPDMLLMHTFLEEDCLTFKELNHVEKKFYHFLESNIKEKSNKMKSFEQFLLKRGPTDCPALLVNSIQFWMEVQTFQTMLGGSDMGFISKKVVALVSRFLDTSTPPWVKITISDELASLLTEAAVLLAEYPNDERLETVKELVSRSKATVFYHLVQYWVEFSEFYKSLPSSPAHSSTSTIKTSKSSSSSARVLCPPTPPLTRSPSVLSYSRQDGLQWISLATQIVNTDYVT